jgi:hypothetical protein
MRFKYYITIGLFMTAFTSCVRDEALNMEAAIDACSGENIEVADVNNDHTVTLYVQKGIDLTKLNLLFTLADKATISSDTKLSNDGTDTYDFSSSRNFTVTSEDGKHQAHYTISAIQTELATEYNFENLVTSENTPYDVFYEFNATRKELIKWSSGNQGFKLTAMANSRTDYPTVQDDNGKSGKCLKLTTRDTGSFGKMVKMYIAAGNLFVGSFALANALTNPLKATKFGFPFYHIPLRLTGYYKFKAGDVYTQKGVTVTGVRDKCDIYAMLYKADSNVDFLDGTNATTSSKIVLLARMDQNAIVESDSWTAFDLPFEAMNGSSVNAADLAAGNYKLAIVFSSSVDGGNFNGAVGSTLYIDEVKLTYKE